MRDREEIWEHRGRATKNVFRTLEPGVTAALVKACRARGVTAGGALCAAAVLGASDVMGTIDDPEGLEKPQRSADCHAMAPIAIDEPEGPREAPTVRLASESF